MTLLPSSEFGIRGHEGKRHEIGERCAAPGCTQRSVHGHHLWPRSYLRGQPYEWVELPDGTVIGNRVGLCVEHHNMVTGEIGGHKAWIMFRAGVFWWNDRGEDFGPVGTIAWRFVGPLQHQPPGIKALPEQPEPKQTVESETCPTCGKAKHPKPHKRTAARKTKDWTLTVPADAEIGAEILDGFADDIAIILGFGDESSRLRRYHAVAVGLYWVIQNREGFVEDVAEAANA